MSDEKPPSPKESITLTHNLSPTPKEEHKEDDRIALLLKKIEALETRSKTPPKKKRQPTEKQLENLRKAREKRNANMEKRREIKKNIKIQEKKIVNEELKNISQDDKDVDVATNNDVPDNKPPSPVPEPIKQPDPPAPVRSDPIPIPQPTSLYAGFSFAKKSKRR